MEVHKVDDNVKDAVGLPNDVMAGNGVDGSFWSAKPYQELNPYTRIDWSKPVCAVDPASGNCNGGSSCRCYGDWVNKEAIWEDTGTYPGSTEFLDNGGGSEPARSFLLLKPDIHGQKRTRYMFSIYIQDNLPLWYRDDTGGYTGSAEKYFPLDKVVFRITDPSSPPSPGSNEDTSKDEFYMVKGYNGATPNPDDFKIDNATPEFRIRWGRYVFNAIVYHTFKFEKDYLLQVTAIDIENNQRTLRVPISMAQLAGLRIHNKAVESQKNNY
jgi:hypothetical protein